MDLTHRTGFFQQDSTLVVEEEFEEVELPHPLLLFFLEFIGSHCNQIFVSGAIAEFHTISVHSHHPLVVEVGFVLLGSFLHFHMCGGISLELGFLLVSSGIHPRVFVLLQSRLLCKRRWCEGIRRQATEYDLSLRIFSRGWEGPTGLP